jgi:phage portal protein BeeE
LQQWWFDFCQQMTASVLLRGNGYAPILRDSRGKPQQWIPVNPDRVIVLEAVERMPSRGGVITVNSSTM